MKVFIFLMFVPLFGSVAAEKTATRKHAASLKIFDTLLAKRSEQGVLHQLSISKKGTGYLVQSSRSGEKVETREMRIASAVELHLRIQELLKAKSISKQKNGGNKKNCHSEVLIELSTGSNKSTYKDCNNHQADDVFFHALRLSGI